MSTNLLVQRETRAWQLQVWFSFVIAVFLCGVGLAWLPGRDLDRAFMVMGYFFCLSAAFVLVAALAWLPAAHAGRSCEAHPPTVATVTSGLRLAQRTHEALEAQYARDGTQVVVLARAGRDLTKYGLRYSHLGIAWRTADAQGRPAWRVLHKLNACGTATADVWRQGLGEFFLDDLWRFETAWVVPKPVGGRHAPAQARQRPEVQRGRFVAAQPQPGLGAVVAFDDHPDAKRFTDRIETVMVDSVFAWMERSGLGGAPVRLQDAGR